MNENQPIGAEIKNSVWIKMSYGSREMFGQWISIVFGSALIFFYKQTIGLESSLVTLAFVIWSIWNAVNDPLMGYLMERIHMPWEKTNGFRRFPWIVMGAIPFLFAYLSIYFVPGSWDSSADKWKIFGWMLGALFFYDLFFTIFEVNATSMFPEKFPGLQERRSAQLWGTILGIIGITLGFVFVIPMMADGGVAAYQAAALVSLYGGLILFVFMVPGLYENDRLRKINRTRSETRDEVKPLSFVKTATIVFKNKDFMAKVAFFFGYQAAVALVNGSALYVVNFVLDDPDFIVFMLGMMLVGALITVPLWLKLANVWNNNKKTSLLGALMMIISFIPMMFVNSQIGWLIALFIFGVGLGGQWFMDPPTMGDVLDDIAVKTGKREQSIYYGYQTFIIRFGEAFKALAIAFAHWATNLPEGVETYDELNAAVPNVELAQFGVRIHTALIPMVLVIIAALYFWKKYTLNPEKVAENKQKLAEMGI